MQSRRPWGKHARMGQGAQMKRREQQANESRTSTAYYQAETWELHVLLTLLEAQWEAHNIKVPLTIISSPYRDISMPLIKYIKQHREEHGSEVVTVYLPEYIVGHWWENLLHNHKARRIRQKLMLVHGVTVALVPWLLDSSDLIYGRRSRPLPGQDRRGEPVRPVPRRAAADKPATATRR